MSERNNVGPAGWACLACLALLIVALNLLPSPPEPPETMTFEQATNELVKVRGADLVMITNGVVLMVLSPVKSNTVQLCAPDGTAYNRMPIEELAKMTLRIGRRSTESQMYERLLDTHREQCISNAPVQR